MISQVGSNNNKQYQQAGVEWRSLHGKNWVNSGQSPGSVVLSKYQRRRVYTNVLAVHLSKVYFVGNTPSAINLFLLV